MKNKTKTLPAIRITDSTFQKIVASLNKINDQSLVEISLQDFRRMCYEFFSSEIIKAKNLSELLHLQ